MNQYISIIIPTYKKTERLLLTLTSLNHQDYPVDQYEILIVNDACDPNVDRLIKQYEGIKVESIHGEGKGPARAKNKAISQAVGDIFVFLDDDVLCRGDFLINHAGYYKQPDADNTVVTAKRRHVYMKLDSSEIAEVQKTLLSSFETLNDMSYKDPHCSLLDKAYTNGVPNCNVAWVCLNGCNFSAHRAIIEKVNGFDGNLTYLEDTDIGLRMWEESGRFHYCENALNYHMEHADTINARKGGWLKNYPLFEKKHKLTAKLYALFFNGKITLEEFDHHYKEQTLPAETIEIGSYWFWEEFALRRWKNEK